MSSEASNRGSVLLPSEASADLENALDILRRNRVELDEIGYGDAGDEVRSAAAHIEIALRILSAEDQQ